MKLRSILVPILVLSAFASAVGWLLLAEPPKIAETRTPAAPSVPIKDQTPDPMPETAAASDVFTGPKAIESADNAPRPDEIRDVSPDGVSAPQVTANLKRIEPSKRYLELKNPPIEPIPDGPLEFARIQVLDAGHLKSGRLTIKLANIEPLALDDTCETPLGGSWPCGTRARTFLRGLIRQLKITCEKVEDLAENKILANCKRGSVDLSSRLVRYGWARPSNDASEVFQELATKARDKRIGQWIADWDTSLPEADWATEKLEPLPELTDFEPEIVEWSLRSNNETTQSDGPSDLNVLDLNSLFGTIPQPDQ